MKLNQTTNLRVEDFPSEREWIGRLFTLLNPFVVAVGQILDLNIDFSTNIRSVTKAFDSSSLTVPITFAWPHSGYPPADLTVVKAMSDTTPTVMLAAWEYNASTEEVSITSLYEVTAGTVAAITTGTRYRFTVRVTI